MEKIKKKIKNHHLKIAIIQLYNYKPLQCVSILHNYLQQEQQLQKQLQKEEKQEKEEEEPIVHYILLPEGSISFIDEINDINNLTNDLKYFIEFTKQYKVILICGTLTEIEIKDNQTLYYTTCIVINEEGKCILKYRKRDTMGMMENGTEVGICDTLYGKIGVLICYDAERPQFIEDTLSHSPFLIFNPAHLSSFRGVPKSLIHSSWKIALETSSRYFEYLSHASGVTFIRCDQPSSGNTFITTPTQTIFIPSLSEEFMTVYIPYNNNYENNNNNNGNSFQNQQQNNQVQGCRYFPSPQPQLQLPTEFGRIRTEKFDNTGLRTSIQIIHRNKKLKNTHQNQLENSLLSMKLILPRGKPKGYLVILSILSLEIWNPIDFSLVYSYQLNLSLTNLASNEEFKSDINSTPKFVNFSNIELDGSIICVYDNNRNIYEWRSNEQGYQLTILGNEVNISNLEFNPENNTEFSNNIPNPHWIISDKFDRKWIVYIDWKTDYQCLDHRVDIQLEEGKEREEREEREEKEKYLNHYNPCASLCVKKYHANFTFESLYENIVDFRVILPVSCSYLSHIENTLLYWNDRVGYLTIVNNSYIYLIHFNYNRVTCKLTDIISNLSL